MYLVSNLLPNEEPIKWKVREAGVEILSSVMSLTTKSLLKNEAKVFLSSHFLKILSFLDVLSVAGTISKMNYLILRKELENILETLAYNGADGSRKGSSPSEISESFFEIGPEAFDSPKSQSNNGPLRGENEPDGTKDIRVRLWSDVDAVKTDYDKGQTKGHGFSKGSNSLISKGNEGGKVTASRRNQDSREHEASGREAIIVKYLDDKNNLTVKDFSRVIKGCSEKTIQRELLRLVGNGVLKKVGERRWSRYSLAR